MNDAVIRFRNGGRSSLAAPSRRVAIVILAAAVIWPMLAQAQVLPRFYWKSLSGAMPSR